MTFFMFDDVPGKKTEDGVEERSPGKFVMRRRVLELASAACLEIPHSFLIMKRI